jgi:hypothetical protein
MIADPSDGICDGGAYGTVYQSAGIETGIDTAGRLGIDRNSANADGSSSGCSVPIKAFAGS